MWPWASSFAPTYLLCTMGRAVRATSQRNGVRASSLEVLSPTTHEHHLGNFIFNKYTYWIYTSLILFHHSSPYKFDAHCEKESPFPTLKCQLKDLQPENIAGLASLPPPLRHLFDGWVPEKASEHFWLLDPAYLLDSDTLIHWVLLME